MKAYIWSISINIFNKYLVSNTKLNRGFSRVTDTAVCEALSEIAALKRLPRDIFGLLLLPTVGICYSNATVI